MSRRKQSNVKPMTSLDDERMLIIGGSGFVGVNLAKHFSSVGLEVSIIDVIPSMNFELDNITYIKADMTIVDELQKAIMRANPTTVIVVASW